MAGGGSHVTRYERAGYHATSLKPQELDIAPAGAHLAYLLKRGMAFQGGNL